MYPRGRRTNNFLCWDVECESLYQKFLSSPDWLDSKTASLQDTIKGKGFIGQRRSAISAFALQPTSMQYHTRWLKERPSACICAISRGRRIPTLYEVKEPAK